MKHISEILTDMGWPAKLKELERRVRRNVPDHRDPERFHVEKDEIAHEIGTIAKEAAE